MRVVGRRLTGSSVKLAVGLRADVPSGFDTAALPRLPVTTLSEKASEQLLDLHHSGLDPQVRRLVLDEALGNPLALLELPPHVLPSGRAASKRADLVGYTGWRPASPASASASASAAGLRRPHRGPR